MAEMAVDTCFWPLYEVENGKYTINYKPKQKMLLADWMKLQKRFDHIFTDENKHLIEKFQKHVDELWEDLLKKAGEAK
jgi:pyruvate ferredoxin oxidoreductase beta subunit